MQHSLITDIMESKGVTDPAQQQRVASAMGIMILATDFLSDAEMLVTLEVMQQCLKTTLALQEPGMVMGVPSQVAH